MGNFGKAAAAAGSLAVTAGLLAALVFNGIGSERRGTEVRVDTAFDRFHMYVSNALSDAAGNIMAMPKRYWISRDALQAPEPNPDCFERTDDPEALRMLIHRAEPVLEGQELYFSPDTDLLPGTEVRCYLDDTILAITWKQAIDHSVYTFSEVKILHPSQFRRFLAGGSFGADEKFTTTEMAGSANAVVASSGDFYQFRRSGVVVYDGIVRRVHNGLVDTCYVDAQGNLGITTAEEVMDRVQAQKYVDENRIQFSLAFGPALVREGQVCTPAEYSVGEINDCYPRAALCQRDRLHYLLAVVNAEDGYPDTPDIHTFARRMQQTGCPTAYALDGGQTAVLAMGGELVNSVMYGSQRQISDIIYFATAIPHSGKENS